MAAPAQRDWTFVAACVLALGMVVGAYSNSFQNGFHFDDAHVVESNLYIRSLSNIPRFFRDASTHTSLPANAVYRPLVVTSLTVDYWLGGGLNVRQFHVSQLTMLVCLGVMLYFLFFKLLELTEPRWWNRYLALATALLFSLHTTATETMNLIHVRSELLSGLGIAGSFLVYLYMPRSRRLHLYLLPMIVGALAKPPAVMFAPLFLVYVILFEQGLSMPDLFSPRSRHRVREAIVKSLPALVVGALVFVAINTMNAPTVNYGGGSSVGYLRTQFFVWLHYARLFFLPVGLTADTDWTVIPYWYDTRVVAGLMFLAFLLWTIWNTSKSPSLRPVAFGIAWFGLGLLPASSVIPLAEVSNEHRVFFPYIGLSLAVVWGVAILVERWSVARPRLRFLLTRGAVVLALIVIGGNAVGTFERNKVYLNGETLWRDVVEKSPANGRALMNYGLAMMAQGRNEEAKQLFERALVLTPNYSSLEINLAIVNGSLGRPDLAEAHFARGLQLAPSSPASHFFYGRWLAQQGLTEQALPYLRRAVELGPGDLAARYLLLDAYAKTGAAVELKALAEDTLKLVPGDSRVTGYLNGKGEVVLQTPPPQKAPAAETPETLLNKSLSLYQTRDFQGSIDAARRALALRPGYPEAYNNVAAGHAALGQWDEAIKAAREALRLRPDYQLARNNLAWAESEKKKANR